MLRVSAKKTESNIDINMIMGTESDAHSDIKHAHELMQFAGALASQNESELKVARDELVKQAGAKVLVDAAGVAANFQRMVRIADATGIPVDSNDNEISNKVRAELDLYQFDQGA
ncbi:MAG: phosphoribosylcarboxyaminoimidazole (NCAIR) mutase [Candidatus Azotimanducaceae bacterium]|jgi:phosphoribosylcarboxyaminoimidazole (NCAIR) mutase